MRRVREEVHTFLTALTFFTRIPAPAASFSEQRQARCAIHLPLIGWMAGGIAALVWIGAQLAFPRSIAVVMSMAATIWLTGALHEDGFADFCDGFGGGWSRERILEIMKDSRLGSYGAIGLWGILLLKWVSLYEMPADRMGMALVAGHSLSRLFAVSFTRTLSYAGDGIVSKAAPLCSRMSRGGFVFAGATGLLPLVLFRQPAILLCLPLLLLLQPLLGRYLQRRIGGYTGDCLGAAQQMSEAAFYLFVLSLP